MPRYQVRAVGTCLTYNLDGVKHSCKSQAISKFLLGNGKEILGVQLGYPVDSNVAV